MCVLCCVLGDEQVDEQIRLRDDVIFQLKTQQQRTADFEYEFKGQPSQTSIKEEGMFVA